MTVQEILRHAHERVGLVPGVGQAPSPLVARHFYDTVMDEIVGRIGLLYQQFTTDLVSGEASYCLPALDRIEAAWVLDANDKKTVLAFTHSRDSSASNSYIDPAAIEGTPRTLITEGIGRCRLYPRPDYAKTAGLIVAGYGPYEPSSYTLTTECPLKRQDEEAVILGVMVRLHIHKQEYDKSALTERQYQRALNKIEIHARDYTPASAMPRGVPVATRTDELNPLNL